MVLSLKFWFETNLINYSNQEKENFFKNNNEESMTGFIWLLKFEYLLKRQISENVKITKSNLLIATTYNHKRKDLLTIVWIKSTLHCKCMLGKSSLKNLTTVMFFAQNMTKQAWNQFCL